MRITTDYVAARNDPSNRKEAEAIIRKDDPELAAETNHYTMAQWIDDMITDWVDELRHERGVLS